MSEGDVVLHAELEANAETLERLGRLPAFRRRLVTDAHRRLDLPGPGQPHTLLRIVDKDVEWVDVDRRIWFSIRQGFTHDGASLPRLLRGSVALTAHDLTAPGEIHDFLYRKDARVIVKDTGELRAVDRKEADQILRDVVEHIQETMPLPKGRFRQALAKAQRKKDRALIYAGVRLGGKRSFRKKKVDWTPN